MYIYIYIHIHSRGLWSAFQGGRLLALCLCVSDSNNYNQKRLVSGGAAGTIQTCISTNQHMQYLINNSYTVF